MIGCFDYMECGQSAKTGANGTQQVQVRKCIARAFEKQHRHTYFREVLRSLCSRFPGWVQWKAKEHESFNACERLLCGSERAHTATQRLASSQQRQIRRRLGGGSDGRAYGRSENGG
jgi:hypothetical protein